MRPKDSETEIESRDRDQGVWNRDQPSPARPSPKAQEIVIEISVLSVVRCTKEQDAAVTDKLW